jgi:hypothetical protein
MYELNAANFHEAISILANVISMADGRNRPPQNEVVPPSNCQASMQMIDRFLSVISTLHVPITKLTAIETKAALSTGKLTFFQAGDMLLTLTNTLRRELTVVKVFSLDSSKAAFYDPSEPLFGADVDKKFPSISYEIDQSGKCYACDLSTASAFHSIRSMEAGIRAIARCLGIPDPTKGKDRNWSNVSASIKLKMDQLWPPSTGRMSGDGQLFDKMYGAIAGMQNPYRNETMHLEAKYDAPEALHIFELVKGLMQKIASRMDELGEPKA